MRTARENLGILFSAGFGPIVRDVARSRKLEFDVGSVEKATAELESQGYKMLVKNKKEPWGERVRRHPS